MNKILVVFLSIMFLFGSIAAFAIGPNDSVNTIADLEQAIQDLGYEQAIAKAMESGSLSMNQIASTVLAKTENTNPILVISALSSSGVPQNDIIAAASDVGISPGIINAGIQRAESQKVASTAGQQVATDAALGFSEGFITNPKPPTVITGRPGGNRPADPISPSSRL